MTHAVEHLFKGVCICACRDCTAHFIAPKGHRRVGTDVMACTCPADDPLLCGAKTGV